MITKKKDYLMPAVSILEAEPINMICSTITPGSLKSEDYESVDETETDGGKVEWNPQP